MGVNYRVRFVHDDDGRFEECNGKPGPLSEAEYAENQYMADGQPVPYADYLNYQGNPDRHIFIGAILSRECECCGAWREVGSLWRIDFMDDDPEAGMIGQSFELADFDKIPGYLQEVARELLHDEGQG